tara:strand:- start:481 stop:1071 length:591 start_codon:yes stop_codon:yes gene_type:complete
MEEYLFLLNTVLVIIICGIILKIIGNLTLASYTKTKSDVVSCSQSNDNTTNNNGYNGYTLSFTGTTIIGMSLLFIMILVIYISVIGNQNVKELIKLLLPVFITLIVVSYDFFINIKFKDKLIKGDIASEYFGYLIFFSLFLFIQTGCISKYIKDISDKNNSKNESKVGPVIYLLSLMNMIILGVMNIIIAYFSTDG